MGCARSCSRSAYSNKFGLLSLNRNFEDWATPEVAHARHTRTSSVCSRLIATLKIDLRSKLLTLGLVSASTALRSLTLNIENWPVAEVGELGLNGSVGRLGGCLGVFSGSFVDRSHRLHSCYSIDSCYRLCGGAGRGCRGALGLLDLGGVNVAALGLLVVGLGFGL